MKTSELTNVALDWAVAKCEGHLDTNHVVVDHEYMSGEEPVRWEPMRDMYYSSRYSPSTDWAQGGPIIEREGISINFDGDGIHTDLTDIEGRFFQGFDGLRPLIAAMRCFVASRLGDEVDVPDELM